MHIEALKHVTLNPVVSDFLGLPIFSICSQCSHYACENAKYCMYIRTGVILCVGLSVGVGLGVGLGVGVGLDVG